MKRDMHQSAARRPCLSYPPPPQDYGLLWKHVEYRNGHNESRRSRRLVISSIATVVNYEYCFYWYLYQVGGRGGYECQRDAQCL